MAGINNDYIDLPNQRRASRRGDNRLQTRQALLNRRAAPAIASNLPLPEAALDASRESLKFAGDNRKLVASLPQRPEALAPQVPAPRQGFCRAHVLTPTAIHQSAVVTLERLRRSAGGLCRRSRAADDGTD